MNEPANKRGGARKNAGQAADLPPGERVQSYRLTLDTETVSIFKALGGAKQNISRGARQAARIAATLAEPVTPKGGNDDE